MDAAEVHKRFPAAAEYLSGIYILQRDYGRVSNSRLAAWTGVSGSAVTQALGRLKRLGLARQLRYENIELTVQGRALAITVLRRHYLLEHLLVRVLEFPWEKADDEAKRLQSEISDDLAEHLYHRLGSPQACPHGNPMPGARIEGRLLGAPRLSKAPGGTAGADPAHHGGGRADPAHARLLPHQRDPARRPVHGPDQRRPLCQALPACRGERGAADSRRACSRG